ncbi:MULTISPECIES: FAH family protein [Streptomyces]|uniref:FAH family protein n=1 Tax=Streptomyces koelreuteriae TaxID=2838015 RepID=A0ABX8FR10_9ACTN|nr:MULTISPECIES: FAH family protein [Streptomyces]QWB23469.1 FAH family protein [Streptomyces koelreuteriae]UUA06424.1 FAH family protein [Streptomyces koelreuteriae]UUA14053.1 FAH family protein [Streptomyces sp. CRCS-T-1]
MTVLFECTYRGGRYFGLGLPKSDEPLSLTPLTDRNLGKLLTEGGDVAVLLAASETVTVPVSELDTVSFRPPLLPDHLGDAVVGGFMQTHNVKVDADTPSQPNWFLKGLGDVLRTSGQDLRAPAGSVALTEEAEVVLVYVTDADGMPRYVGYTFGNDLTDIGRFRRHRGHLSYAKLCDAGVAPWLFLDEPPRQVTGHVTIERDGEPAWRGEFTTGTKALHYGLDDIMSELFSYDALLAPGRVHYVYIGADRSSFHDGFRMTDRDRVTLDFASHGVTLSNTVRCASPMLAAAAREGS